MEYDPPAWLRVLYLIHAVSAGLAMGAGLLAWWWVGRERLHRAAGLAFTWLMALAVLLVLPMVVMYPDDVLLAIVPMLLWMLYAGSRGKATWATAEGFRLLTWSSLAMAGYLIVMAPVRAWVTDQPTPIVWAVFGGLLWWAVAPDLQRLEEGQPAFSRRVHGATMILAMVLSAEAISPDNLGPLFTVWLPGELFPVTPPLLGLPPLFLHLRRERVRSQAVGEAVAVA